MTDSHLGYQIFRGVKYLTYALLSLNIWFFLAEEIDSARFAIASGEDVVMGVQLFSATLDTLPGSSCCFYLSLKRQSSPTTA